MRTSCSGPVRTTRGTSHAPTASTAPASAARRRAGGTTRASPTRAGRNEGRAPSAAPATTPASTAPRGESLLEAQHGTGREHEERESRPIRARCRAEEHGQGQEREQRRGGEGPGGPERGPQHEPQGAHGEGAEHESGQGERQRPRERPGQQRGARGPRTPGSPGSGAPGRRGRSRAGPGRSSPRPGPAAVRAAPAPAPARPRPRAPPARPRRPGDALPLPTSGGRTDAEDVIVKLILNEGGRRGGVLRPWADGQRWESWRILGGAWEARGHDAPYPAGGVGRGA